MKKMKKLFCSALAAAMLMATMSGCGSPLPGGALFL